MSAGLFALLDDVAAIARVAAASIDDIGAAAGRASTKAFGVVVDDTAVTPQYVRGLAAERELPIIKRIAIGSIRNKLLIILPAALLLSQFLPWLLTPILMLGGTYLCFEGAEKVIEKFFGKHEAVKELATVITPEHEKQMTASAIRTDLILSAEIMVIALNEVAAEGFVARALILIVVAIGITALVYGVVALIVKMDDLGLRLAQSGSPAAQRVGRGLVAGMPGLLAVIGAVGTVAMLWVGGHILLVGANDLGWHGPYDVVHHLEVAAHDALPAVGGVVGWLTNTAASAVIGVVVGSLVALVMHFLPFGHGAADSEGDSGGDSGAHRGTDGGADSATRDTDEPGDAGASGTAEDSAPKPPHL